MRPETKAHALHDPSAFETSNAGKRPRPDAAEVGVAHLKRVGLSLGGVLLLLGVALAVREILIKLLADAAAWFGTAQWP